MDVNDTFTFYAGRDFEQKDYGPLFKFLYQKDIVLVGYNSDSYDLPMLRYILNSKAGSDIEKRLHDFSAKLIDDNYRYDNVVKKFRWAYRKFDRWKSIDLMRILAFDKLGIGLKQTAINLKWPKIQDLPLNPNRPVPVDKLNLVLSYNLNDVLITKRLYEEIEPLRKLREGLSEFYNVNLLSASDSRVANILLEKFYSEKSGKNIEEIRDKRTRRPSISLKDCVAPFVHFETDTLNDVLGLLKSTEVHEHLRYKFSQKFNFGGCTFVVGIGGLHSEDSPGEFESDNYYIIMDADVASYYPNLIINNKFYPKHLGPMFIEVLKSLTKERLDAKHSGDKVKADGLKITINSIFGKLGFESFWLYDPLQMLSTTINGQLGLLMLIEGLTLGGIPVISANTDGIVCKVPKNKLDDYYKIAKEWEQKTGLELEFTKYDKYVRRDVNSYITQTDSGKIKEKGAFLTEIDLKKSYNMPIVAKALRALFIDDVPVKETLNSCKDIMEFCVSTKVGKQFVVEYHTKEGVEELQRTNRFYISNTGGTVIKRNVVSGRRIGMYVGRLAKVLNDYDSEVPFDEYDVDISYYENEVMKVVDAIRPPQMSLFEEDTLGSGYIPKMDYEIPEQEAEELVLSAEYLEKLGKNQLLSVVKRVVEKEESLPFIDPKYAYVMDISIKPLEVKLYALCNGEEIVVGLNNSYYKKNRISPGNLIYCETFDGSPGDYVLNKYKIVENFVKKERELF